ncbi:MAG TPA: hypothetical protein VFR41_00660 [Acidimicrobiia bacterium]|nr:hypothetical protein [Acidimicrobiia bacterium]
MANPNAHRCHLCGQALYRRAPRVLGEEHRIGANLLPIDRHMIDRIYGEPKRGLLRRKRAGAPVAWQGRFTTTPASEPAARIETPPFEPIAPSAPPIEAPLPRYEPAVVDVEDPFPADEPMQPTVDALGLDVFVRPNVVEHGELDPDVRALVDDLYAQAHAELAPGESATTQAPAPERGGWVAAFVKDEGNEN